MAGKYARYTAMQAIRKKCLDCMCGNQYEVRMCPCKECPLYEYRYGHRPGWDKRFKNQPTAGGQEGEPNN